MAESIARKIKKLMKALQLRGEIYFYDRKQLWSEKHEKVYTMHTLVKPQSIEEYKRKHPHFHPKKGQKTVRETICKTPAQIELLLTLVRIYKGDDGE